MQNASNIFYSPNSIVLSIPCPLVSIYVNLTFRRLKILKTQLTLRGKDTQTLNHEAARKFTPKSLNVLMLDVFRRI